MPISKNEAIKLTDLRPADVERAWLWQFVPAGDDGVLRLKPVKAGRTAKKFHARDVGAMVELADGSRMPALIEGISLDVPEFSRHNRQLILWIEDHGWFALAQYFVNDDVQAERGPHVLCGLLKKDVEQVFPIRFDISARSDIPAACLAGAFEPAPAWGLPQEEVMGLLVREIDGLDEV